MDNTGLYVAGGAVATVIYGLMSVIKKYVPSRYLPLFPLVLTPLIGAIYASITHQVDVIDAIKFGVLSGASAISAHETIDHTIKNNNGSTSNTITDGQ